jgi:hypothetical protein
MGFRRTLDFHPGFCDPGAWATAYRNYWSGATFARFPSSLEASHFYAGFAHLAGATNRSNGAPFTTGRPWVPKRSKS